MIRDFDENGFCELWQQYADPFTDAFPFQYAEHWRGKEIERYEVFLPDEDRSYIEDSPAAGTDLMLRDLPFYQQRAIRQAAGTGAEILLYAAVETNEIYDRVQKVSYFRNYALSEEELKNLSERLPDTTFFCAVKRNREVYLMEINQEKKQTIRPISFRDANDYIRAHHRHNSPVSGGKFAISLCEEDGRVLGVATCGRPVSRELQERHPYLLEITRVCTEGGENACSRLYSRCCEVAKALGYEELITYTLESEGGASLRASGFSVDCDHAGGTWRGKRFDERKRKEEIKIPEGTKIRWIRHLV